MNFEFCIFLFDKLDFIDFIDLMWILGIWKVGFFLFSIFLLGVYMFVFEREFLLFLRFIELVFNEFWLLLY